jgi:hypothetical protein
MATPIMTASVLASGNLRTPRARMIYPALFKPRNKKGETDKDKARYQITVLVPKGSDLTAMKAAVEEVINDNVSAKMKATTKVKTPFLKTEDQPRWAEYADEYPVMIRLNAKQRPDVVTPKGDRTVTEDEEADEIYAGRWCRVSCQAFWYDTEGNKGVSFGLQNVQLLLGPDGEPGEALAGGRVRGTAEFEAAGDDALDDMVA